MNVTADELRTYIEIFHRTLESVSIQYLPPERRKELLHAALLPARIIGYVSTNFGVAIEYEQAAETVINIVKGSARVEDLLVRAPKRVRSIGPLMTIAASGIRFVNGKLAGAFPFRLSEGDASVTYEGTLYEVGTWKRYVRFAEVFANRKAENWSLGKAESRAKDEVLVAMVQLGRAREKQISISDYITQFKAKTVLLLGDYDDEGINRLKGIEKALTASGYDTILIKDIPDHPHQDVPQKVVAVGAICRFIVVDDSSKSGHLLEVQLCKQNSWVTILLRAGGVGGSWMTAGASHASNVIVEMAYDQSSPEQAVAEAVRWAEAKIVELERKFEGTYPWRTRSQQAATLDRQEKSPAAQ